MVHVVRAAETKAKRIQYGRREDVVLADRYVLVAARSDVVELRIACAGIDRLQVSAKVRRGIARIVKRVPDEESIVRREVVVDAELRVVIAPVGLPGNVKFGEVVVSFGNGNCPIHGVTTEATAVPAGALPQPVVARVAPATGAWRGVGVLPANAAGTVNGALAGSGPPPAMIGPPGVFQKWQAAGMVVS